MFLVETILKIGLGTTSPLSPVVEQMERKNVLGLSVGTHKMGVALFKGNILKAWQVKNYDGVWSTMKLRAIVQTIERYIKDHSVAFVTLKVPEVSRTSPAIEMLTDGLIQLCKGKNVQVLTCTIMDLKTYCKAKNKNELIQYVLSRHPELYPVFAKSQNVKKVYYVKIFEAVLASMLHEL